MKTTDDAATSMQDNGGCAFSSDDINLPAGKRIEPGARPPPAVWRQAMEGGLQQAAFRPFVLIGEEGGREGAENQSMNRIKCQKEIDPN